MKDWAGSAYDPTTNSSFLCTNLLSILGVHETQIEEFLCLKESQVVEPASLYQEE